MIFSLSALVFSLQLLAVQSPDPRVQSAVARAAADLGFIAPECGFRSACTDAAITVLAQVAVGHFRAARVPLARGLSYTPLEPVAFHAYWTATADTMLLRERWEALSKTFSSDALTDTSADPAVRLATYDALLQLGAAVADRSFRDSVRRAYPAAEAQLATGPSVFALTFGLYDAERADSALRAIEPYSRLAWPLANGLSAWGHYKYHDAENGFALLQRMWAENSYTPSMLMLPLVRGLIGWETDAPNRAFGLEPHLPESWSWLRVSGLAMGATTIDVALRREAGTYQIELQRQRPGMPLSMRIAPSFPLGSRIRNVTVNETDVPLQVEIGARDIHVVIETTFAREARIEIEYVTPRRRASARQPAEHL